MTHNGRLFVLFTCNLVLYLAVGEFNDAIGPWTVHLHLDVLYVVFFGLFVRHAYGLLYAALMGLFVDAAHAAPTGVFFAGYLLLWLLFAACQRRVRRQNPAHVRVVAAAGQLLWLLALGLIMAVALPSVPGLWTRWLADLALSCLAVGLLAWPWCHFQNRLLYTLGWDLEAELAPR